MKKYINILSSISESEAFSDASGEELRAIIAILERQGTPLDPCDVSRIASVSLPRAKAAIAFWEGAGVIREEDSYHGGAVYVRGELDSDTLEMTGEQTAAAIRERELADVIEQCAELIGKPTLPTEDVKRIVALNAEYGLSEEYIAMLAASVAERSDAPTVAAIVRRAKMLYEKDITTVELLEAYIKDSESRVAGEMEIRRAFGIYHPLSKKQRELVKRWLDELAFDIEIIGEAYDITVNNTGTVSFSYIDKILTSWHEAGCMTVEDCRRKISEDREKKASEALAKRSSSQKKKEPEKPKYGNYDPEEVFARALERSYGHLNKKDGEQ